MQRILAATIVFALLGSVAVQAQTAPKPSPGGSSSSNGWPNPPSLAGSGGPFPVDPPKFGHPTGLWVLDGSECDAADIEGIQIEDKNIVLYDPRAATVSFSTEGEKAFSVTDVKADLGTITDVVPRNGVYRFVAELDQGDELIFDFEVLPDQKATIGFGGGAKIPLTSCTQS
ncbi:hypothetical protein [Devosia sp. 2618]|uniref:hypothetical protein n=1 Tax=Devosia sp. 2618 TaxID=3156454 RepID=UPI00339A84E3